MKRTLLWVSLIALASLAILLAVRRNGAGSTTERVDASAPSQSYVEKAQARDSLQRLFAEVDASRVDAKEICERVPSMQRGIDTIMALHISWRDEKVAQFAALENRVAPPSEWQALSREIDKLVDSIKHGRRISREVGSDLNAQQPSGSEK